MARFLPLLLLLLVTVAVRWESLHESLWLDEMHTAWVINGDWNDVAPRARIGNQSPLYFYLLKSCSGSADRRPWHIRLPSLLSFLVTMVMLYWIALRMTDRVAIGLFVATVAAFDPKCIFYATEARPYAAVQMIALLTVASFCRCIQTPTLPNRLSWTVGCILLCFFHYTAVLVPLTTVVAFLWLWRTRASNVRYSLSAYVIDVALVGIATIPLWGHMLQIAGRRQQWEQFISRPSGWRWFGHLDLDFLVLVPLLAFLTLWLTTGKKNQSSDGEHVHQQRDSGATGETAPMFGMVAWLFVVAPVAIVWAVSAAGWAVVLLYRYVIYVPPLALATWCGMTRHLTFGRQCLFIVVVLGYCVYGMGYATRWQQERKLIAPRGENWRTVADEVRGDAVPILLRSGYVEAEQLLFMPAAKAWDTTKAARIQADAAADLVEYCLGPLHALYDFGDPARMQWPLPNDLTRYDALPVAAALGDSREAWIILRISRKRYKESIAWTQRLIAARGGGNVVSESWHGRLLLVRLEFDERMFP